MSEPRDEPTVRNALTVAFDTCNGCRACVARCTVFPLMFDLIHGRNITVVEPRTAGDLTTAEQDRITDACTRCGACVPDCPHHIDLPALADEAVAMRRATGQLPLRRLVREWMSRIRAGTHR
jgi:ferredoxin